jgi:phenylpropionate dioxygenase-like ring-hydroxylating dioxygenase large terminal subunit
MSKTITSAADLERPVTIAPDAYISADFARAERDGLWRKVWLQAGRMEDVPDVGNYITYDIGDDSVMIIRTDAETLKAYHNVCPHRGRKLIDTPHGQRNARGTKANIVCGFHGWTFNREGACTYIPHQDD